MQSKKQHLSAREKPEFKITRFFDLRFDTNLCRSKAKVGFLFRVAIRFLLFAVRKEFMSESWRLFKWLRNSTNKVPTLPQRSERLSLPKDNRAHKLKHYFLSVYGPIQRWWSVYLQDLGTLVCRSEWPDFVHTWIHSEFSGHNPQRQIACAADWPLQCNRGPNIHSDQVQ